MPARSCAAEVAYTCTDGSRCARARSQCSTSAERPAIDGPWSSTEIRSRPSSRAESCRSGASRPTRGGSFVVRV